ncbi:MAG: hypothetical protein F4X17_09940 [Gemmatimonadetes bacterium]|nr:hypothetical protein [Gemmatimonadota bacterium]
MDVLSREELDFFAEEGYVVARQVIDRDQAERTGRAVWAFTGMDPDDPETWYPEDRRGIMVEIYHHQTIWDNRTAPRVHRAFSQIWGTDKLWVSHDRASISPPALDKDAPEHNLHWDAALDKRPLSFGVQGVLYLSDTPTEQGAFICVPGFHQRLDAWLDELPEGANPREQDLLALGAQRIGAEAGDLVIWRTALPHTASVNRGDAPRVAQYITMSPAGEGEEARRLRTEFWQQRLSGLGRYAKEREHYEEKTAELTSVGRRLAGVEPWE